MSPDTYTEVVELLRRDLAKKSKLLDAERQRRIAAEVRLENLADAVQGRARQGESVGVKADGFTKWAGLGLAWRGWAWHGGAGQVRARPGTARTPRMDVGMDTWEG